MRRLEDSYNVIYTDLDNTLIYGFMTDLMDITWDLFKSQLIGEILMYIQAIFGLYKVNHKLLYQIKRSKLPTIILTARKESNATHMIVDKIFKDYKVVTVSMATPSPSIDKTEAILDFLEEHDKPVLFDDNKLTRQMAILNDIDAYDPTTYVEEKVC